MTKKVAVVVGTRPEAIKMAPVYLALDADPRFDVRFLATAQHREMLDQILAVFSITPDLDLDLMRRDQSLTGLSARILTGVQEGLARLDPDIVLVHGDTATCLFSTLAAFYSDIPVGHVEAGLRTYDFHAPWPEEMNRRLTDPLCRWAFAPTAGAAANLRAERIPEGSIHVTGNTVVDALLLAREIVLQTDGEDLDALPSGLLEGRRMILVTGHRRESFGQPFREFCQALKEIAAANEDVCVVYPVHLNPNVQQPVRQILAGQDRVHLIPPVGYLQFVSLMDRCHLIVTDSGGIQEEAPTFHKPVLVTRETTERPEAVHSGAARLVGTSREMIVGAVHELLTSESTYQRMCQGENPYGDGLASRRIADILAEE